MRLTRFLPIVAVALAAVALTGCQPPAEPEATTNGVSSSTNAPENIPATSDQAKSASAAPAETR